MLLLIRDYVCDYVVVMCTSPPESSGMLARSVVEERLAACVNITQVRSTFLWMDELKEEAEDLLIIKTVTEKAEALAARIRSLHPYDLPEIVILPMVGGDEDYLSWISESVRGGQEGV